PIHEGRPGQESPAGRYQTVTHTTRRSDKVAVRDEHMYTSDAKAGRHSGPHPRDLSFAFPRDPCGPRLTPATWVGHMRIVRWFCSSSEESANRPSRSTRRAT